MKQMLDEEYPAFLNSYEDARYQALRINPSKTTGIGLLRKLPFTCSRCHGKRTGFITKRKISRENIRITRRACTIFRSRAPWRRLHIWMRSRAKKVLDLCAAPGGKSTQIAAAMQGKGLLVSNEIHPARAKILSENMERMGVKNVMVTNESPQTLGGMFTEYFDRIMVDAPCSGEGMFRKNEQACEEWSPENVQICAARQQGNSCMCGLHASAGRTYGLLYLYLCTGGKRGNDQPFSGTASAVSYCAGEKNIREWQTV